jgi:carboxyl-terminal processing protease
MQENNNINWRSPLKYSLILIIGIFLGIFLKGRLSLNWFGSNKKVPVQEILDLVKTKYVDNINNDSAELKFIDYYLSQLDPHSVYVSPAELTDVNDQLMSNYKGIGIEFQMIRDSVFVTNVIKDGPAYKAGLKVGDILLTVDDNFQLSGKKLDADIVRAKIKNSQNAQLKLNVLSGNKLITFTLTKGNIPVASVDASYKIKPGVGYIHIDKFSDRTYESFMQALEPLVKDSIKTLVIDLRGNGGGLLSEAVAIADELIPGNKLLVYTQGANAARTEYVSKRDGIFEKGKVIVWMDETSASASEVLAGALQDWDRATIIGRTSFGKGLVQQQFNLSNGGALRLTVARYYTPLGRNIQRPFDKGKEVYMDDFINRVHENAMGKHDSLMKGKEYKTPGGKKVFDGGGIYPDKWVTGSNLFMDSTNMPLLKDGLLSKFVIHYYLAEQNNIKTFKNTWAFINAYKNVDVWTSLVQFANPAQQIALKSLEQNKQQIQFYVLEEMARKQWDKLGYYEAKNSLESGYLDALP